jgi:segregation and condensation protein B
MTGPAPLQTSPDNSLSLLGSLEALLFAAPGLVSPAQLADALGLSTDEVEAGLGALEEHYDARGPHAGIRLQRHGGRVQLTTVPFAAAQVERFLGLEATSRLSRAALDALAIIAYQQPVTRPRVDAIRGVNSDGVLKSLLSKGLIQEVGRAETVGRPIMYGTTSEFLQHFGLSSLSELPPLPAEAAPADLVTVENGSQGEDEPTGGSRDPAAGD